MIRLKKFSLIFVILVASLSECSAFRNKIFRNSGVLRMESSVIESEEFDSEGKCYFNNSVLIAVRAKLAHLDAINGVDIAVEEELILDNASVGVLTIKKAKKVLISNSTIATLILADGVADPVLANCTIKKMIDNRKSEPVN